MKEAELRRSTNRANLNRLFNGEPPLTACEAEENNANTNVNFLEGTKIIHDATSQFNNAFMKPGNYFSVTIDSAPVDKKMEYGRKVTRAINRIMKRSLPYIECTRSKYANVVLHGPGPINWEDKDKWCPTPLSVPDLLLPSKTLASLENLDHFAIRREYTPGKLFRMTHGKKVDPGWNMTLVNESLKEIKDQPTGGNDSLTLETPEALAERYKADLGYYESDSVPTVKCWDFYFRDDEDENDGWHRRIVKDMDSLDSTKKDFLYDSKKRVFAKTLSEIIHIAIGDGAVVAPFRYHSVRSLGFMLYAVCMLQNRLRCKFNDAVFESLLWYFRVNSPDDEDRVQKVDLHNMGIIPTGLEFVPANERFVVREGLVGAAMQQNRQNMSENSASFVQDVSNGSERPMTATETMARVNSGNALVSSMLNLSYTYAAFEYREICRRFCRKGSSDPDVKKFQEEMKTAKVPEKFLDVELWDVEPERVLGAGNKTLEIAQANQLMGVRQILDPDAAREVLHIFVEANTDDPALAEKLVPLSKKQISNAVHLAQDDSAVLMLGLPKAFRQGISHSEYVQALLVAMEAVIQRIEATGGMATPPEVIGLQNIAQTIGQHLQFMSQDDKAKEQVKQFGDVLGKNMNMVKAYIQRLQEAQQQAAQQNGGLPPEAIAKIESSKILAETAARIKEAKSAQQMSHKELAFKADQGRKAVQGKITVQEQMLQTQADIAAKDLTTEAEIIRQQRQPQPKPPTGPKE